MIELVVTVVSLELVVTVAFLVGWFLVLLSWRV